MKSPALIGAWLPHVGDNLDQHGLASYTADMAERLAFQHPLGQSPLTVMHLPWGNQKDDQDFNVDARDARRTSSRDHEMLSVISMLTGMSRLVAGYQGAPYKTADLDRKHFNPDDVQRWCWPFLQSSVLIPAFDASNNSAAHTVAGMRVEYARKLAGGRVMREAWPMFAVPPGVGSEAGAVGTPLNGWKDPNTDWICAGTTWFNSVQHKLTAGSEPNLVPPGRVAGRIWLFWDWMGLHRVTRADYEPLIEAVRRGFSVLVHPPHRHNPERMTTGQIAAAAAVQVPRAAPPAPPALKNNG